MNKDLPVKLKLPMKLNKWKSRKESDAHNLKLTTGSMN